MSKDTREAADGESVTRAFYDIAQLLESAVDSDVRTVRVLDQLRSLVPYEQCAVLDASPGREPCLFSPVETSSADRAGLLSTLTVLFARLSDSPQDAGAAPAALGMHLAVPLIGLDEVVGVLFVRRSAGAYEGRHVRRLSVVGAKLAAYFSMLRAVAQQSERALQLEQARLEAERANRAKDEFLAMVSHELRTPLNTILVWADALRSEQVGQAERQRAFEAIERSVRAESKLIDDLLDLSEIAKAAVQLDLRAVEPAKLIRAALRKLRPRAEQKAIQLNVVLDESDMPLLGDPKRLGQVVAHLVANAIKFTPVGGRVDVRLERIGVFARIRVLDSGAGMSPEVLSRLFEPFLQADSSSTRAQGGLGVGLALVKDLVVLHGGSVSAESPGANQGATFTVELPLAAGAREDSTQAKLEGERGAEQPLAGIHVLLVDDDVDICEVLQFVLEAQGAVVTVANSAAEALRVCERSMPNVLLSDIAMPGVTGYELMQTIVARAGVGAPPAAALSAYARKQDLQKALASGFKMLLEKPIDAKALIAAVVTLAGTQTGVHARERNRGGERQR